MDPEVKKELDQIHALEQDNHRMLRAIRRDHWLGFIGKIIFWLIILALPFYIYQQYVQPFMAKFSAAPGTSVPASFGIPTTADLQKLINSYTAGKTTP